MPRAPSGTALGAPVPAASHSRPPARAGKRVIVETQRYRWRDNVKKETEINQRTPRITGNQEKLREEHGTCFPSDLPEGASCLRNLNFGLVVSRTVRQYISFGKKKKRKKRKGVLRGSCLNFALTLGTWRQSSLSMRRTIYEINSQKTEDI